MNSMTADVRADSAMLIEVIALLDAKTPLATWPSETITALAKAIAPDPYNAHELGKAERLTRHLFAGTPPKTLAQAPGASCRRSDRLRADLADLTPRGAGLHLLVEGLC